MKSKSAFSSVEILIVLIIIAIVSLMIIPIVKDSNNPLTTTSAYKVTYRVGEDMPTHYYTDSVKFEGNFITFIDKETNETITLSGNVVVKNLTNQIERK